jgi:glutamyl-tRNA synthetase
MLPPVVRFAPSPTGFLHLGNARVAVVNWLFARHGQGQFVLRIDDTDRERSQAIYDQAIQEDLTWLGLGWDAVLHQSGRADRYAAAIARLRDAGLAYACFESPEELAALRERQRAQGLPPRYDRQALAAGSGRPGGAPYWRLQLSAAELAFDDLIMGPRRFAAGALSDPVILREDGTATYLFASAVDDAELGISHVIRGEDHVTNTALQLAIFAALEHPPPRFAHLPLIADASGRQFSKRLGALSLRSLREQGVEPTAIVATLAALGTAHAADPARGIDELVASFSLGDYGRAPPKLQVDDLPRFSAAVLHHLPYTDAAPRLRQLGLAGIDEAFWVAIRGNLAKLEDAREWWEVCRRPLVPVLIDPPFLAVAADHLPEDLEAGFAAWIDTLRSATGRRGKALFHPLRLALTGREHGPELKHLLPLLSRERALQRLRGKKA